MFDNTRRLFHETVEDVKRLSLWVNLLTQVVYIAYLIYAVATTARYLPLNIALLALSLAYFIAHLTFTVKGERASRKVQKKVRDVFVISRRLIQLVIVASSLLIIYRDQVSVVTIPVLFSLVSALTFVLNVVIDVITRVVTARYQLFEAAFKDDLEELSETGLGKVVKFGAKLISGKKKKAEDAPDLTETK